MKDYTFIIIGVLLTFALGVLMLVLCKTIDECAIFTLFILLIDSVVYFAHCNLNDEKKSKWKGCEYNGKSVIETCSL